MTSISLAACQAAALEAEGLGQESLAQAETTVGLDATTETIHQVLSEPQPSMSWYQPCCGLPFEDAPCVIRTHDRLLRSHGGRSSDRLRHIHFWPALIGTGLLMGVMQRTLRENDMKSSRLQAASGSASGVSALGRLSALGAAGAAGRAGRCRTRFATGCKPGEREMGKAC